MAINKKFPNYSKTKILPKILSQGAGPNRHDRRRKAYEDRNLKGFKKRLDARMREDEAIASRADKTKRRIVRAVTRRMEREKAMKEGKPVKYSIK